MRILAVGGQGANTFASSIYENIEDVTIDQTDLKPNKNQRGYDAVITFNAINRVSYGYAMKLLQEWKDALKERGELLVIFPSLEWVANEVLNKEKPSPALNALLFGTQRNDKEFFKGCFTLMQMRDMLQTVRLQVTFTQTAIHTIGEYETELHVVRAVKAVMVQKEKK